MLNDVTKAKHDLAFISETQLQTANSVCSSWSTATMPGYQKEYNFV